MASDLLAGFGAVIDLGFSVRSYSECLISVGFYMPSRASMRFSKVSRRRIIGWNFSSSLVSSIPAKVRIIVVYCSEFNTPETGLSGSYSAVAAVWLRVVTFGWGWGWDIVDNVDIDRPSERIDGF